MNKIEIDHTSREHALLSPSSSSRWLACTPCARLEEKYGGEETTSKAAEEGTVAHEIGEYLLTKFKNAEYLPFLDEPSAPEELKNNEYYSMEMLNYVADYVNFCYDRFTTMDETLGKPVMMIEEKFDLTMYVPECFGSCDFAMYNETTLEIIDLKYGKGVQVSATDNSQLKIYALGVLRSLPPAVQSKIQTVNMSIAQVRLGNYETFTMSAADLTHWAIHELRPTAKKAFAGEGVTVVGSHCKFCKFKAQCRAQKDALVAEFDTYGDTERLTNDEIGEVLEKADMFINWLEAVKTHALQSLNKGETVKGWKLVEGRSVRVISDTDAAEKVLTETFNISKEDLYNFKFKGIGDLEKLVGKKQLAAALSDIIVKPAGTPTLAKESDKRPSIGSSMEDFEVIP